MSTRIRIAELPHDLRAAGWFLNNRGNAVYAFNTRWWMESPLFALPGRRWSRRTRQAATPQGPPDPPEGLIAWLRQAAEDVQPLLSALEQALPDPEQRARLRFRLGYWERRIIVMASVALAGWRLAADDDGWHITPPRRGGEPFTLPATALPAAWELLAADEGTRDDPDAPRRIVERLRALAVNNQEAGY